MCYHVGIPDVYYEETEADEIFAVKEFALAGKDGAFGEYLEFEDIKSALDYVKHEFYMLGFESTELIYKQINGKKVLMSYGNPDYYWTIEIARSIFKK